MASGVLEAASPAHAQAMALIHAAAFPPGGQWGGHWGADAMALQLACPGVFGFVDRRGGLVLARVAADEAEILTLAVLPEARRAGLGGALLRATMATAAGRGAAALLLEVAAGNLAARALYAGLGFATVGRRPRYYGAQDALILRAGLTFPDQH